MTYGLYTQDWRFICSVQARSMKEARAAFAAFHKGTFWIEHEGRGDTKKVRL
jgi:hypothetical protein